MRSARAIPVLTLALTWMAVLFPLSVLANGNPSGMATVNLTSEFGLVVRRLALEQRGVGYRELLDAMETGVPLDVNEDLVSFGPHFGGEAATEFVRRLEALGLRHIEDFFVFIGDFPQWCGFTGVLKSTGSPRG